MAAPAYCSRPGRQTKGIKVKKLLISRNMRPGAFCRSLYRQEGAWFTTAHPEQLKLPLPAYYQNAETRRKCQFGMVWRARYGIAGACGGDCSKSSLYPDESFTKRGAVV
jgi:hypothetical protein